MVLEMFWVAEYFDGQALPQLDPFSGVENTFAEVDHRKVKRFWWLPVTAGVSARFPNTCVNPLLKRHCIELGGARGFVCRRMAVEFKPVFRQFVSCYVLGVEGGPRREIYADGTVIDREGPEAGETQELLHG